MPKLRLAAAPLVIGVVASAMLCGDMTARGAERPALDQRWLAQLSARGETAAAMAQAFEDGEVQVRREVRFELSDAGPNAQPRK